MRARRPPPLIAAARVTACLLALGTAGAAARAATAPSTPTRPSVHLDPAEGASPLDLVRVSFGQVGTVMRLDLETAKPFEPESLDPRAGRSLCLMLRTDPAAPSPDAQLCALGDAAAPLGLRLRLTTLPAGGFRTLPARIARPSGRRLTADVPLAALGLTPGRHAWQARTRWLSATAPCTTVDGCDDLVPDRGTVLFRIRELPATGCAFRGPLEVRGGPPAGKRVALTFDDGPAAVTAKFLTVLERAHAPATFFVVGREIPGREALLRRMLADGDMIGNHTYDHAHVGAGGAAAADELRRTQAAIRAATGFTPCLFRPPYGDTSAALVATAGAEHLTSVLWNDDPQDWRLPGAGTIRAGVVRQVRPGSIVISHDGGGPRDQTLAALPSEIRDLRRLGYRLVTVNDLLGLPLIRG